MIEFEGRTTGLSSRNIRGKKEPRRFSWLRGSRANKENPSNASSYHGGPDAFQPCGC